MYTFFFWHCLICYRVLVLSAKNIVSVQPYISGGCKLQISVSVSEAYFSIGAALMHSPANAKSKIFALALGQKYFRSFL